MNNQYRRNQDYTPSDIAKVIERLKGRNISSVLTVEEVNLPGKAAYNVAYTLKFRKLETNQLRKIFDQIKLCENYELKKAKETLYGILPQVAYSVGREICDKEFFDLLKECISEKGLQSTEDVKTLVKFMESIVAYYKYFKEI